MRKLMHHLVFASITTLMSMAHARAVDITWIRDPGSPVLTESSDATRFDSGYIADPTIVYDSDTNTYFMYYTGCTDEYRVNREALGLATASTLDGPWTKYDGVGDRRALLTPGLPGDYDYNRNWGAGTIRKIGPNSWEMWTVGDSQISEGHHVGRVGYATSSDGYNWTKYAGSEYGGAVLEDFSATVAGIGTLAVLKEDHTYHAWYSMLGIGSPINHATSTNGTYWTIQGPVSLSGDIYSVDNVVKFGDTYYMATSRSSLAGIDFYTSTDKTTWTILNGASLTPTGAGWDAVRAYQSGWYPVSETDWHLFYTGANVYDDTQSVIGYARATLTAPEPLPRLDSSAFNWKYEFEGTTADTPDNLDIDGNGQPDMMLFGSAAPGTVADGVMTLSSYAVDDAVYGTSYIDDFGWKPALTDGIWKSHDFSGGFTIEASIKVIDDAGLYGATSIAAGGTDLSTGLDTWINVAANGVYLFGSSATPIAPELDNTDGFHVFRVAVDSATGRASLWRDGDLLVENLPDIYSDACYNRIYIGDITSSTNGTVEYDYVRFTEDAYAPTEELPLPGDANGDGIVNDADAARLAANWQTASGASWSMGDFNDDGAVNDVDATILAANWQMTAASRAASVPEPSSLALMIAMGLAAFYRRARQAGQCQDYPT